MGELTIFLPCTFLHPVQLQSRPRNVQSPFLAIIGRIIREGKYPSMTDIQVREAQLAVFKLYNIKPPLIRDNRRRDPFANEKLACDDQRALFRPQSFEQSRDYRVHPTRGIYGIYVRQGRRMLENFGVIDTMPYRQDKLAAFLHFPSDQAV